MSLVDALREVVGGRHVLVDDDVRAPFEVDWTRRFREIAAMRAIKAALDPGGLLNPGAVLQ